MAIIHLVCRHAKLKALLTGIAFQPVNQGRGKQPNKEKNFVQPNGTQLQP